MNWEPPGSPHVRLSHKGEATSSVGLPVPMTTVGVLKAASLNRYRGVQLVPPRHVFSSDGFNSSLFIFHPSVRHLHFSEGPFVDL